MKKLVMVLMIVLICMISIHAQKSIAIIPFTGGDGAEGDTLAGVFSRRLLAESEGNYEIAPRTSAMTKVIEENAFQRSGLTDADTIVELGKGANADYVVTGHIQKFGVKKILIISMTEVVSYRQTAGQYTTYEDLSEMFRKSEDISKELLRITETVSNDTNAPVLSVLPFNIRDGREMAATDSEVLAQILACEIANSGKYAVVLRTSTINQIMVEHNIQRSGITDWESIKKFGEGTNAEYFLTGAEISLGSENIFTADILSVERLTLQAPGEIKYNELQDGLYLMKELADILTSYGVNSEYHYYVSDSENASDWNSGNKEYPFETVQKAVDAVLYHSMQEGVEASTRAKPYKIYISGTITKEGDSDGYDDSDEGMVEIENQKGIDSREVNILFEGYGSEGGIVDAGLKKRVFSITRKNSHVIIGANIHVTGGQSQKGAGFYLSTANLVLMSGSIHNNYGSGVYVCDEGSFIMNEGIIYNNKGASAGGGVYIENASFRMTNGTISENSATGHGGGVASYGSFIKLGGRIIKNSAPYSPDIYESNLPY